MKKVLIALALCLLVISFTAIPAYAKPVTTPVREFSDTPAPGKVIGYAIFNNPPGKACNITVEIYLYDAVPRQSYYAFLNVDGQWVVDEEWYVIMGSDVANAKGQVHFEFSYKIPPGEHQVYVNLDPEDASVEYCHSDLITMTFK